MRSSRRRFRAPFRRRAASHVRGRRSFRVSRDSPHTRHPPSSPVVSFSRAARSNASFVPDRRPPSFARPRLLSGLGVSAPSGTARTSLRWPSRARTTLWCPTTAPSASAAALRSRCRLPPMADPRHAPRSRRRGPRGPVAERAEVRARATACHRRRAAREVSRGAPPERLREAHLRDELLRHLRGEVRAVLRDARPRVEHARLSARGEERRDVPVERALGVFSRRPPGRRQIREGARHRAAVLVVARATRRVAPRDRVRAQVPERLRAPKRERLRPGRRRAVRVNARDAPTTRGASPTFSAGTTTPTLDARAGFSTRRTRPEYDARPPGAHDRRERVAPASDRRLVAPEQKRPQVFIPDAAAVKPSTPGGAPRARAPRPPPPSPRHRVAQKRTSRATLAVWRQDRSRAVNARYVALSACVCSRAPQARRAGRRSRRRRRRRATRGRPPPRETPPTPRPAPSKPRANRRRALTAAPRRTPGAGPGWSSRRLLCSNSAASTGARRDGGARRAGHRRDEGARRRAPPPPPSPPTPRRTRATPPTPSPTAASRRDGRNRPAFAGGPRVRFERPPAPIRPRRAHGVPRPRRRRRIPRRGMVPRRSRERRARSTEVALVRGSAFVPPPPPGSKPRRLEDL